MFSSAASRLGPGGQFLDTGADTRKGANHIGDGCPRSFSDDAEERRDGNSGITQLLLARELVPNHASVSQFCRCVNDLDHHHTPGTIRHRVLAKARYWGDSVRMSSSILMRQRTATTRTVSAAILAGLEK